MTNDKNDMPAKEALGYIGTHGFIDGNHNNFEPTKEFEKVMDTIESALSLQAKIDSGEYVVLPSNAGDRLGEDFLRKLFDPKFDTKFTDSLNAIIKSAPQVEAQEGE